MTRVWDRRNTGIDTFQGRRIDIGIVTGPCPVVIREKPGPKPTPKPTTALAYAFARAWEAQRR